MYFRFCEWRHVCPFAHNGQAQATEIGRTLEVTREGQNRWGRSLLSTGALFYLWVFQDGVFDVVELKSEVVGDDWQNVVMSFIELRALLFAVCACAWLQRQLPSITHYAVHSLSIGTSRLVLESFAYKKDVQIFWKTDLARKKRVWNFRLLKADEMTWRFVSHNKKNN